MSIEKIAVIIPTRGDRDNFLSMQERNMLQKQTLQPDILIVDRSLPTTDEVDLVPRVKGMIHQAIASGATQIFIIEDDDYYPPTYLEKMKMPPQAMVAGCAWHFYYHIRLKKFELKMRPMQSALFLTGFRPMALMGFEWPNDNSINLDFDLWSYFTKKALYVHGPYLDFTRKDIPIGIKHGIGLCAGAGHYMKEGHSDPKMKWLKERVSPEHFKFYQSLYN